MSSGRPPARAVAKEDGGGPGLRALLTAPRGFERAFEPDMDEASETARSEGGRGACKAAGGAAKSSILVVAEAEVDGLGVAADVDESLDSGESKLPGGELIVVEAVGIEYGKEPTRQNYRARSIDREQGRNSEALKMFECAIERK